MYIHINPNVLVYFVYLASYGVGLFFYVSKIPESMNRKWVAKTFITSHLMWHIGN